LDLYKEGLWAESGGVVPIIMAAAKALASELKDLKKMPLEGVTVKLVDDSDLFKWEVAMFGPPDTIYTGGYFKAHLNFPKQYPFEPPSMKFTQTMFHPNVYAGGDHSGEICISILHPPGEDAQSGELPEERWNPAQRIRTILLSVISLLNEPNTFSPANVDASVAYRKWKEGSDDTFKKKVLKSVAESKKVAEQDEVEIPITVEEYCINTSSAQAATKKAEAAMDWTMDDDYDVDEENDFMSDDDDENAFDSDDDDCLEEDDDDETALDSGNE